jgi:hypothetical protein
VNTVFDAIGDGGNGRQSLGMKKTYKQTKGSLDINEQPTNNNPSSKKQHKANIALGGRQSLGMKKTYTQAEASHERQVDNNQSMCNEQHEKVALGGNFKSPKSNKAIEASVILDTKKHGGKRAAQYLSPSGKGSGTKHTCTSQRPSPQTNFFSPNNE